MEWEYNPRPESLVESKANQWEVSKILATLLLNKGFSEKEKVNTFINPSLSQFRNPFDFEKMQEVVNKIVFIKENRQKIFIYGDYDVDGITAAVFLVLAFREIGIEVDYYIPNRMEESYGLDKKTIDYIHRKKGKLIITVDTGINSIEDVKYAKSLGIDVIITDHHKSVKDKEDDELLYINPKLSENYKFKFLAGAGVALKVAQGVYNSLKEDCSKMYKYLDIVMIGTVADVVPMTDENRIIIREGLKTLKETKVKGLIYLMRYLKFQNKDINTTDISYFISPLINSLGRIGVSKLGADFFLRDDEFEIYNIIEEMKKANKLRRELEKNIFDEANEMIKKRGLKDMKYLFLGSKKWHPGVIGVVSSRLSVKYGVPVILMALKDGIAKASCRSITGINIFNILKKHSNYLVRFGGHDLAAGFIAKKENLFLLEKMIAEEINRAPLEKEKRKLIIDLEYSIENIDENMIKDIGKLAPFGLENPHPLFLDRNLVIEDFKKFGVENRHFNGVIRKGNKTFQIVAFDLASKLNEQGYKVQKFDIVYYPEKIYYKGEEIFQLRIKDLKVKDDFFEVFTK
ncbi:single-stranded-DNA-specific exonuclease RecJ [Cetobacterium sp. SF1]|uniref:single-stranded-DNA-specific exonuclease RecJ n=1 Tax=Cetobacterium sp. SF1 TaxID=3417654 RepID=UPI003CF56B76